MTREDRAAIAKETMAITKQGFYINEKGKRVDLVAPGPRSIYAVDLYPPEKLQSIMDDDDGFFSQSFCMPSSHSFYLVDADSFEAVSFENTLVMNFANAHHPGGGFLHGASAQEESLCRTSTLYASIGSKKASAMYQYNNDLRSPVDSDYMTISPNVLVFRDRACHLLDEPFHVAVATLAVPNKNGAAATVPQIELDNVMKHRLRRFLYAAARQQYRHLVLGAWGCGAFGHNPNRVATYFYELFFDEHLEEFFETVIFAVLGGGENYHAFRRVFGSKIEDCGADNLLSSPQKNYVEAIHPSPVCNHTSEIGSENIGFTQGVLADGVPFEAELWETADGHRCMNVVLSDCIEADSTDGDPLQQGNAIGLRWGEQATNHSVLTVGMAIRDLDISLEETIFYTSYLERMGLLSFVGEQCNGYVQTLTDVEGNDLIAVAVSLSEPEHLYATTPLSFRPFPNHPRKRPFLTLISGGKE